MWAPLSGARVVPVDAGGVVDLAALEPDPALGQAIADLPGRKLILTNGTISALVVADAVVRLLPGVLGDEQSAADESFSHGLLEYPQYTRPAEFRGWKVPDVLLSGHHAEIEAWRRAQSRERTRMRRPDLEGS